MLKIDRLNQIKSILQTNQQVEVSILSSLLKVSDVTIRNDLEELEEEGYLTRFRGGARINEDTNPDMSHPLAYQMGLVEYSKEKESLGTLAAGIIQEREWIFLGPGSTTYYIAKALCNRRNINICTNNFLVANILHNAPNLRVLFIGGMIDHLGAYSYPDNWDKAMNNIYLDKAFFSVDGVDLQSGYTLSDQRVYDIIHTIKPHSHSMIMAVDSSKFDQRSFMQIGDLDFADTVITNSDIPEVYIAQYKSHSVDVVID